MGEIVPFKERHDRMVKFFEARKGALGQALARVGVTPDRLTRALYTSAQKTPALVDCTLESLYKSMLLAAQAGLMPDGVTQQAHLIPRKNGKKGTTECNLQIGYRGYLTLCRRSGEVTVIAAHAVYQSEKFKIVLGTQPKIEHEPNVGSADPGPMIGVYAVAHFVKGGEDFEWMPVAEIEALRVRSAAGGQAWDTDYVEMCKKTVLRRLCKRLPQSEDAARLLELDAKAEAGTPQDMDMVPIEVPDVDAMPRADAEVRDVPPAGRATRAPKPTDTAKPPAESQGTLDEDPDWRP